LPAGINLLIWPLYTKLARQQACLKPIYLAYGEEFIDCGVSCES
jgi:hypothetical protein